MPRAARARRHRRRDHTSSRSRVIDALVFWFGLTPSLLRDMARVARFRRGRAELDLTDAGIWAFASWRHSPFPLMAWLALAERCASPFQHPGAPSGAGGNAIATSSPTKSCLEVQPELGAYTRAYGSTVSMRVLRSRRSSSNLSITAVSRHIDAICAIFGRRTASYRYPRS